MCYLVHTEWIAKLHATEILVITSKKFIKNLVQLQFSKNCV
jgi:hypothetical protein